MPSNPLRIRGWLFRRPSRPSRIKSRRYRISSMIEVCLTPSSTHRGPCREHGWGIRGDQEAEGLDQTRNPKMSIRSEDVDQIRRYRSDQKISIRSEDIDQIRRYRSDQKMSIRSEDVDQIRRCRSAELSMPPSRQALSSPAGLLSQQGND